MASNSPYLVVENVKEKLEVCLWPGEMWKLGRSDKRTVELQDETISRNHAMIQCVDGEYCLIDLGSHNGSFVNGRRVSTPVTLKSGDQISVGQTQIVFRNPSQPSLKGPSETKQPSIAGYASTVQISGSRLVTVLVVDIRDYTVLTNAIDQSLLCRVMGTWFSQAERIMQKHGSAIQKYIGDAVMALWVHSAREDERKDLLRILSALTSLSERLTGSVHDSNWRRNSAWVQA